MSRPTRILLSTAASLLSLTIAPHIAQADESQLPVVKTAHAVLSGVTLPGNIRLFKGIRYAHAPTGDLRWKPPAPPPDQFGVTGTRFGDACMQPIAAPGSIYAQNPPRMSEDCLFLNVWAPAHASRTPVMVWIHGGALRSMWGWQGLYNGAALARKGVIVVTLDYRLGVFGYLALSELTAESPHHSSGNYGLLDQIAALQWVHENIAQFGGDPANVTLFGESAGALSAIELMTSPLARGLFQKAIIQSGYMVSNMRLSQPSYGQPSAEAFGAEIANKLGAPTLPALRAMDARKLLDQSYKAGFDPQATIDGWVLPKQIVDCFDRGDQARIPVIVGFNAGEIRSLRFFLPPLPATAAGYSAIVHKIFGDLAGDFLRLYPAADIEESALLAARDAFYGWSAVRLARAQTRLGVPAYLYFFNHSYPAEVKQHLASFHGSELPYEFGNIGANADLPEKWPKPPADEQDKALSQSIMNYFTAFARDGRPVDPGSPQWKSFGNAAAYMDFKDKPLLSHNLVSNAFALQEQVIARRRAAGTENWYINVGLASPVLPPLTATKSSP